jgi:hypothetical protein
MIIQELVYDFQNKGDKLDAQFFKNIRLPQIIRCLNEAQLTIVKRKYGIQNPLQKGFQAIQKRTDELQILEQYGKELKAKKEKEGLYTSSILDASKYFLLTRLQVGAKKECCSAILNGVSVQTDDMNVIMMDETTKPNFEWRRCPFRIASNKILVYGEGFEIEKIIIDYLRYPEQMDMVGYEHFDGTQSSNKNCELPEFIQGNIVDEAVKNCKYYLGDLQGAQAMEQKIINND